MKKISFIFFFTLICFGISAQIEATTSAGRKVTLKTDGTWFYADANESDQSIGDCEYRINQSNEASGEVKRYTKLETIAKDKEQTFKVSLRRENDKRFIVAIYTGDLGCVTTTSTLMIRLFSGEVIKLTNYGSEGCDAGETMFFELDNEIINKLMISPFVRIRITGTDFFADLSPLMPNFFVQKIKCVQ